MKFSVHASIVLLFQFVAVVKSADDYLWGPGGEEEAPDGSVEVGEGNLASNLLRRTQEWDYWSEDYDSDGTSYNSNYDSSEYDYGYSSETWIYPPTPAPYVWSEESETWNQGEGASGGATMSTCSGVADTSDGWDLVTKDADCAMVRFESKMDIYGSEHRLEFVCYKDSGLKHQNTYNQETWEEKICMKPGVYQLNGFDSYGDGWNNGEFQVVLVATGEKLVDWVSPPNPDPFVSGGANFYVNFTVPSRKVCGYSNCGTCVRDTMEQNAPDGCAYCAATSECAAIDSSGDFMDGFTCGSSASDTLKTTEECQVAAPASVGSRFATDPDAPEYFTEGSGKTIDVTWYSTKLSATKMLRFELVENPPGCYYEDAGCKSGSRRTQNYGSDYYYSDYNSDYNSDSGFDAYGGFDPYASYDGEGTYYDPWMSSSETYESYDFFGGTAAAEAVYRVAYNFGEFANGDSGTGTEDNPVSVTRSFEIPASMSRSSNYAIKISDMTDTRVYAYTGKFSIGPFCYQIKLEIDTTDESYPNEPYWMFENTVDTVSFGSSQGTVPGQSGTVNTIDMHGGIFQEDMNFGIWAGTYSNDNKGVHTYEACFDPGTYSFLASDTYGDGWNGAKFSIRDVTSDQFLMTSTGQQLKNHGVSGSGETFVFEVTAVQGVDCAALFRQSCSSCILAASGSETDAHPGCTWCENDQNCRDANQQDACTTVLSDTGICPAPKFDAIIVMDAASETVKSAYPIGSQIKIVWNSVAVSESNIVNIHLLYYDTKESSAVKEACEPDDCWHTCDTWMSCNDNNAWPQQSQSIMNDGGSGVTMDLMNAYEGKWVLKIEYCEGMSWCTDSGETIISAVSEPFIMQYEYDECTTSQNNGFANGKFTDTYFAAQMECYMDQCRTLDTAHPNYADCLEKTNSNAIMNTPSMNTCLCYYDKKNGIGIHTMQREEATELFHQFLDDCDYESTGSPYYMPGDDWCTSDSGGSDSGMSSDMYTSEGVALGAEKKSSLTNCGVPPSTCKNFTVAVELYEWSVESHWEIELPVKDGAPGCFRQMAGPWVDSGEYTSTVCLTDGDWKITGYDSYGDGWNGGGKMSILDAAGAFTVSPTSVEGSSTVKEFTVSSAKCQHSTCGLCVSDDGGSANCGYCATLAKPVCMDTDETGFDAGTSCPGMLTGSVDTADQVCSLYQSEITLTGPAPANTSTLIGGDNTTIIEWTSQNIGGAVAVELILHTNSYVCSEFDGSDCTSLKEYEITAGTPNNRGNDIDSQQQEPADPGGQSFVWKIDPMYPSGDNYMLKAKVKLGASLTIEREIGPFTIRQPCVDIVIISEAKAWSQEMEFKLWDGISTEPILYAFNDPDTTVDATIEHDVFIDGETTYHYGAGTYSCSGTNKNCITSDVLCLKPGPYMLETIDTYGDGWNGGGNIKVKKAANDVTFAGPLYPEGLSTYMDLFVTPPEDVDETNLCPYYEGCGACREGSCGWCLNTGKCTANGGSCDGLYISQTSCPTNIQVPDLEVAEYKVGEPISIKWTGTGFTTYSSTSVSMFKGNPQNCSETQLESLGGFLDCESIEWQYDMTTNTQMEVGTWGYSSSLTWSRFVNDDDYFVVISSNVEDGIFGYSGGFTITDPDAGLCSGTKEIQLTHSSLVDDGTYGIVTEAFITDGSGTAHYSNEMACEWVIHAPPGYNVFLSFLDVQLETGCYDRITVRDGVDANAPVRAYVCAPTSADTEVVEASTQKSVAQSMHLEFLTDELQGSGGFEAIATVVAMPADAVAAQESDSGTGGNDNTNKEEEISYPPCAYGDRNGAGVLEHEFFFTNAESAKGALFSGYMGDSLEYETSMDCIWHLEARLGYVIELEFEYFNLEPQRSCGYDFLSIKDVNFPDGDGKKAGTIKECGTNLPPTFTSISNQVDVHFKSDESVPFGGFIVKYTSYAALPSRRRMDELPAPVPMPNLPFPTSEELDEKLKLLKEEYEKEESEALEELNGTLMPVVAPIPVVVEVERKLEQTPPYCAAEKEIVLTSSNNKDYISDGIANAYKTNTDCKWVIKTNEAGMGIKLDFETFHVEGGEEPMPCEYDYVKILNQNGEVLGKICGRKNEADGFIYSTCSEGVKCEANKFTGPSTSTFYTHTQELVIEFHSDASVDLAGFHGNVKLIPTSKLEEKGVEETRNWVYEEWSECVPLRFGFNEGERSRSVQCGFDNTSSEKCPKWDGFPALGSEWDAPTKVYNCMVEGSSLRWSGTYFLENVGCGESTFCCFEGHFLVQQKNSDQKNSIHITDLVGYGPMSKCQPMAGDSVDYGLGENIYFPLNGEGDNAQNEGSFIVYGVEYTVLKSGGFVEFRGSDQGTSLGSCTSGDCIPKSMELAKLLTIVGIEGVIIVGMLVLWFIYKGINPDKAKNQALKTAQKNEKEKGEMNDIIGKKMERARQLKRKKNSVSKKNLVKKASADDMALLAEENFDNFEGVDLCGMQKLQKIDKRNPQDRKILQAFDKADTDRSGFIDAEELHRAMIETTGKPWTMTQINDILEEFDDDGNGELGVEEFKLLVNSTAGGSLNFNRNKYSPDDYNAPYEPPTYELAEEYSRQDLPRCPEGEGGVLWAKEFCLTRILFGDKKKELRPVWITDIDDCDYGVGISLYFKNLLFLCYMLFGAFLLALPIIISNGMQQSSNLALQLQGSYVSSESLHIGAGVTDLAICVLLALVLVLADEKEKKLIAKIDAGVQTPADYTLVLKNAPPTSEVTLGQWRKYFEDITKGIVREKDDYVPEDRDLVEDGSVEDGKVVSITYCVKGAREIYNLVQKRRAMEDALYFKVRALKKKDPEYRLPVASHLDPPTFMQQVLCKGSIEPAFMLSQIDTLDQKINSLQMSDKPAMGSRMFVTFDTEIALDTACFESFKCKDPRGKFPKVKQACEASDLIYANMATGIWNRRVREYMGYIICFGLIFGSLAILVYLNELRINPTYGGYAVAVANSFLKVFCEFWVKNIERPLTYSDQQFSLMTKLTLARVCNTAILLLFTCDKSSINGQFLYLNTEFVAKVQSTIQADITLSLARVMDGPRLAKRALARFAKPATQTQLNKMYEPTKWNLAERYSDSIKTLFTCLFYVSVLPTGLGYATAAFALAYASDKYCILRTWQRPPEFDYKMSVTARYILEWTLCAHLAITWYLYRKWPFVEIRTEMEKVYTPDQAILVFIYGFATMGTGCFFGVKQFGNVITSMITDSVGEQRCERSCIVRWCSCLRPPEQKFHVERYSQLEGYGLASYNPHPENETAADFESFHVINDKGPAGVKEKILSPKIVAFMPKSEPSEFSTVNKKVDIVEDKKFTVMKPEDKYSVEVASGAAEPGDVELLTLARVKEGGEAAL